MSKVRHYREQERALNGVPPATRPSFFSVEMMLGATVAGIAVLVFLAFTTWDQMRQLQNSVDGRLPQIENRLAQLSTNWLLKSGIKTTDMPLPRIQRGEIWLVRLQIRDLFLCSRCRLLLIRSRSQGRRDRTPTAAVVYALVRG